MIKKFNEYAKTFDLTKNPIMGKYHHSFRVMEFSREIANSINLSEEDTNLACVIGLYHDIARFKQWTMHNTYIDRNSFDHGDIAIEILNDGFLDDYSLEDRDIILKAIKYHNKYKVEEFDERTILFCNIIRDADKLDIMKEQYNHINDKEIVLKQELIEDIKNNIICRNELVKTNADCLLRMLSWVNDLNFEYSYDYLTSNNIIENKFNLLSIYGETEEIKDLKKLVYEKIDRRREYVRNKI